MDKIVIDCVTFNNSIHAFIQEGAFHGKIRRYLVLYSKKNMRDNFVLVGNREEVGCNNYII